MKIITNGPQDIADFCSLYNLKGNYFQGGKLKAKSFLKGKRKKFNE